MFYKKKGFPEEGELLLCTVKKILYHSVFVDLDEYENKEGMIHISEVSPGRIRTLSDFVREGKKIICKVLNVNKEKSHIDLSLRRVSISAKIAKNNEYKQEQKAERLLENIAKGLNKDLKYIYDLFGYKIIEEYGSLNAFFQHVSLEGKQVLDKIVPSNISKNLFDVIKDKIKPKEIRISGSLILKSYKPNGIEIIKRILDKIENKNISLSYIGAPKYRVVVTSEDYKEAENILKGVVENVLKEIKSNGEGEFIRDG